MCGKQAAVYLATALLSLPCASPCAVSANDDASKGDWVHLKGRWDVVSVTASGKRLVPKEAGFNECTIFAPKEGVKSGTESVGWFILYLDGSMYTEWEVTTRAPAPEPGTLDFDTPVDMAAGAKGEVARSPIYHRAIYRLKGDELTVCLGRGVRTGDPVRPGTFEAEAGSGRMLITLKRRTAVGRGE